MTVQSDKLRELFLAALKVPTGERDAFLRQACAGADELCERVKLLIQAHEELGSLAPSAEAAWARSGWPSRPSRSSASWPSSFFFFQSEDSIRAYKVTGVKTCALPISLVLAARRCPRSVTTSAGAGSSSAVR